MATWNPDNVVLTQKGQEILSKVQAGVGKITVSKVVTGGGYVSPSLLYKQTAVMNEKQTMTITKVITDETGSEIALTVTNSELEQEYDLYQIGVYVQHQDYQGDILYTIAQCDTANPDHIPLPSVTVATLQYSIYMEHSNTSNVVIQVNPAGFVTLDMIGAQNGVAGLDEYGKVPQEQLPEFGISNAEIKGNLVDDDAAVITDSQANNKTKRVFWSNIKEILGGLFVPVTRKINKKALSSDVSLNAADVGAADRNYMRSAVVGIGATSYTGWFRVGRIPINSAYKTSRTLLSVKGSTSKGSGILDIVIRTESSAGVLNTSASKLIWHTLTNSYMKNRFAIIVDGNYADLYVNEGGTYWYYNISVLDYMESTTDFTDPSSASIFKLERNYDLSGEYRESITPLLTSSIGFTPEIMGAAKAEHTHAADDIVSGTLNTSRLPTIPVNKGGTGKTSWIANRLIYPSGSTVLSQLAFPSSAGSVLRQGTSGAPYWSSIADLVTAMGAVRIKCGTYTGNGAYDSESSYTSNPQTINVGLNPKAVLVMSETGGMDSGSGRYYGGLVWDGSDLVVFLDTNYGDINAKVITLTNSGFTVYAQRVQMSSSSYRYIATNEDGRKYRYIVFY